MNRYIIAFKNLSKKIGVINASKYALKRTFINGIAAPISIVSPKRDVIGFYLFTKKNPIGIKLDHYENIINWVIPDFGIGSGGHLNIFRMIYHLERVGLNSLINIDGTCQFKSEDDARSCIRKHFFPIKAEVTIGRDNLPPAKLTIATSWTTAYTVHNFQSTQKKLYFVQDIEPMFYPKGSEYHFAENTYRFGFEAITAGGWIADTLFKKYGMSATPFNFSYDKYLYEQVPKRDNKKRILFYARPVTSRRGFELGLMVIDQVCKRIPSLEVVMAGWDVSDYEIPFPHLNAGIVALKDLPDLYCQCDLALIISFTNLSLLPLELMACGCVVVSNRGENVEWLLNDDNAILSDPTIEHLTESVVAILEDDEKRKMYSKMGKTFALGTSWEREAKKIARMLSKYLS